jgi:hypothetical protein
MLLSFFLLIKDAFIKQLTLRLSKWREADFPSIPKNSDHFLEDGYDN